jgi:hypothetical protein
MFHKHIASRMFLILQNVLRSEKAGVIKNVLCKAGAHLKVDQIIIEFEDETTIGTSAKA